MREKTQRARPMAGSGLMSVAINGESSEGSSAASLAAGVDDRHAVHRQAES